MDEPLIVRSILPRAQWATRAMDSLADGGITPPASNGKSTRPKPSAPAIPGPALASTTPAQKAIAIAHLVEDALLSGHVKNYSDAARRLGITKPRMHDYAALLVLSPRVQEAVLLREVDVSVRDLTWLARSDSWADHERWLASIVPASRTTT